VAERVNREDWRPVPDPTELTTNAVNAVTEQYRRDVESLRNILQLRIDGLQLLLDERYSTQTKALDAAFVAAEKAVATALASAEKAVTTAQSATDKRFDAVGEFQKLLTSQAASFLPRGEYDTAHKALEDKLADARDRLTAIEGLTRGISQATDESRNSRSMSLAESNQRMLWLGVAISVIVIVANILVAVIIHH
jgi:hypothetical protein